jgi:hypothetical protein
MLQSTLYTLLILAASRSGWTGNDLVGIYCQLQWTQTAGICFAPQYYGSLLLSLVL